MSEEECPKYKDGDIVWVKLGSCWWPGEVTETGPEDFTAKKPPLAIVKFFNEGTYEFVKSHNHIYFYNCERKHEFIKKGMDSFRANNSHMEKFPGDVSLAEIKTDGNPNILSDPIFIPQKRSSIIAEVFGSPSPKKTPKEGARPRGRASTGKNSSKKPLKVNITHRRFLGCDDYEAHIRVQYPGKDAEQHSSDEEIQRLNAEPSKDFNCSSCSFHTNRIDVMLFHVRCHIKGIASPVQVKKKASPKKTKKARVKHVTSDDDRTNSSSIIDTDSEEEAKPKPKRKKRAQGGGAKKTKQKKEKVQEEVEEEEEKTVTDIRTNLLAEWSDSEDNDETEVSKLDTSGETESATIVEEKKEDGKQPPPPPPPPPEEPKDSNKSCFDFDDEEEDTSVVQTAVGRKIPRVIPPSDKRRSTEQDEDASLPTAEDDKNRVVILNVGESPSENANSVSNDVDVAKEEAVFKDLMDSTSVPDLPEVPEPIKTTPNFPESKTTIKIPDKKSEEVATKLTNPKKRFVKSFEDFELLLNEQRKAQEEKEEELRKEKDRDKASVVEETPKETEPNVTVEPVEEPAKIEEVVEDKPKTPQEKMEVEEDQKIEEEKPEELKTNIPPEEEEIEETKDSVDEKKVDGNLQISKLKCQVMSKLSDEEESPKVKTKSSHRTPRSKILESYRNDKQNEEQSKKPMEEVVEEEKEKKQHAPKKSKILKYNQEAEEKNEEESSREEAIIKEVEAIPEKNPDEEIGKVAQIDEYFKDFLFAFDKKSDTPKTQEETKPSSDVKPQEEEEEVKPTNELTIKCASNDENNEEGMDIAIKTNLTNFNKNDEEMSALSTLAMVSQQLDKPSPEEEKIEEVEETPAPIPPPPFENFSKKESELVPIDGNLTVVSEKDLADGQVEITANASPTYKKPVTLTNFSMDFSECNSNSTSDSLGSEKSSDLPPTKTEEIKEKIEEKEKLASEDMLDIEEQIPSQIVDKTKASAEPIPAPPASKLLERLTTNEPKIKEQNATPKPAKVPLMKELKATKTKFVIKSGNRIIKGATPPPPKAATKAMIISEKIIKPITTKTAGEMGVSVQKITSKRNLHDPDEIDTFIIQKGTKTVEADEELELSLNEELSSDVPAKKYKKASPAIDPKKLQISAGASTKKRGKAKILQQTIITPAGEIIQPSVTQAPPVVTTTADDNVFDINSMPIVLSDQILTPESIENMPIFLSDTVQSTSETITTVATPVTRSGQPSSIVKKTPVSQTNQGHMRLLNKTIATPTLIATPSDKSKMVKTPKILGSVGSKIIKQNSFASGSSKHGKYVIVTQSPSSTTTPSKYTVGKRQTLIKRASGDLISTTGTLQKVQNLTTPEPSGNKIMILTNQQGQQQRVLLTPAQQKMMGYQQQGTKVTKTLVKGNIIHKAKESPVAGSSGLITKGLGSRIATNQTLISSSGHVLTPIHSHSQSKTVRIEKSLPHQRKLQMHSQKVAAKPQKTILIKNQHGQTVRKIQGTDDALLDQQVAEQLEAIKATSGVLQQKQEILNYKSTATPPTKSFRRSYVKKVETPTKPVVPKQAPPIAKTEAVPPLAPISPKKHEQHTEKVSTSVQSETKQERPLNQLVIQDAMGNQTTITEGQILALPSETVDGQPQSYMLVTLDESGNLTPLNNEALLSLDPNLGLGGDLGNTVLQIDQSALKEEAATSTQPDSSSVTVATSESTKTESQPVPQPPVEEAKVVEETPPVATPVEHNVQATESSAASVMPSSVPGEQPGQQLIVTGDPIAAQKFLESLTEGSTDLANILASAEGSSILIHADGQQILINTDSDNQMLLSVNTDNLNMAESSEGGGNPIFATQPSKNQDILAAALADTDVFQQEQNGSGQGKGLQAQLSPNSALYPMNVGNVLETSLTLNSPIMTPLEVPSTNSKKISDESDILNQVPKNVDLPITITDPNISQTVSQQQQVASLMVNELQSNLELSISDSGIAVTSSEMSPSFVYSLPNLDMNQKPFNTSMPLLTEDVVEEASSTKDDDDDKAEAAKVESKEGDKIPSEGSFLDESEGLCTLGGEMCSSLSEPPPDMFDLSAVLSSHHQIKSKEEAEEKSEHAREEAELTIVDDKGGDESVSGESANPETASVTETSSPNTTNEDSCEIPLQPQIVTTLKEDGVEAATNKRGAGEDQMENESKRCKFDD